MKKDGYEIRMILDGLAEDEKARLLEQLTADIPDAKQKQRMKVNVLKQLKMKKRRTQGKRRLLAGCAAAILLFIGLSPSGQRILADIGRRLHFIPGIGQVVEGEQADIFVLEDSIRHTDSRGGAFLVKSILKDGEEIHINMEGRGAAIHKLIIEDREGNQYESANSWNAVGHGWLGGYSFYGIPEELTAFKLILWENEAIAVTLVKAQHFDSYAEMGPTDIQNGLGLTLLPGWADGSIRLDLVEHSVPERRVMVYGYSDENSHSNIDIVVKDQGGSVYPIEHAISYAGTLSEFYFQPRPEITDYFVEIPQVMLTYPVDQQVTVPIPESGEVALNKRYHINGYEIELTKAVRFDDRLRIYVESFFDATQAENLHLLRLEINTRGYGAYGWHFDEHLTVDYYDILNINPKDRKITLRIKEMITRLEGPWQFDFTIHPEDNTSS